MNKELLHEVANHIEPGRNFNMDTWGVKGCCGTTGCVAGHAVWVYSPLAYEQYTDGEVLRINGRATKVSIAAKEVLGLSDDEANELFLADPDWINSNAAFVPAALHWMADNETIDWTRAGKAVGFDFQGRKY